MVHYLHLFQKPAFYFTIMVPFVERKYNSEIKPRFNVNAKYRKRFCLQKRLRYCCLMTLNVLKIIIIIMFI